MRLIDETELPGRYLTVEQVRMAESRYAFATSHAGRRVLEIGCGPAVGLGVLAGEGRWVVGGDITIESLVVAQRHYSRRVPLVALDGHRLPCRDECFDTVLLFEVIYYFDKPEQVLAECRRVLVAGGNVLLCVPNPDLPGFRPSALGRRYFSASELAAVLETHGFRTEVFGAFPISMSPTAYAFLARLRHSVARGLARIPGGRPAKRWVHRTLLGQSTPLGAELVVKPAAFHGRALGPGGGTDTLRILYAIGRLSSTGRNG